MIGLIEEFMSRDHVRIDALLRAADADRGRPIDAVAYDAFRAALLRHIAMEEKVLLPFARDRRGGLPLPIAERLRSEHGHIARLLVPTPTPARLDTLREVLAAHNVLEEGPAGLYALCDALAGEQADALVVRLQAQPAVPLAAPYDGPPHLGR